MSELVERWRDKQAELHQQLESLGAVQLDLRVNTEEGILQWVEPDGTPRVKAQARGLCHYSLRFGSVTMAWAAEGNTFNPDLAPIEGMKDVYPGCGEGDAWKLAMQAADAIQAQYIYRVPTLQDFFFFAISNIQTV